MHFSANIYVLHMGRYENWINMFLCFKENTVQDKLPSRKKSDSQVSSELHYEATLYCQYVILDV